MGNPLLDISAVVPSEVLTKYGLVLNNAILAEPQHLPVYAELTENFPCEFIAGGATQNTMRVAQWMSQNAGFTGFLGCIGDDEFGRKLAESANSAGLATYYQIDSSTPTGTCACLIQDKERSLVANIAAANNFTLEHLKTHWTLVENAQWLYVSGFFLTVNPPAVVEMGKHVEETGKVFGLNIAAPFIVEFFKEPMMQVFPYTDYVFGNETEALKFSQVHGFDTEDFTEIALKMASLEKKTERPRTIVITRGKDSTVVACGGQVQFFEVELLDTEELVDTNGAGDAFVGGFLAYLARDADIATCCKAGNYAAREVIKRSGCTFPPTPAFSG